MSRDEFMYLQDIDGSCEKIICYTQGLSQPDLLQDMKTYDAVVRNLEQYYFLSARAACAAASRAIGTRNGEHET